MNAADKKGQVIMKKHEYQCSKGHYNAAPYELKKCQVFLSGKPCTGKIKRIGAGSRKPGEQG